MSEPGLHTKIEGTKSMPCIELASPILVSSDQSLGSSEILNAVHQQEINKPTAKRSNVKALINKHRLFQEKILNVKVNDFNTKKKLFGNACKNLCTSYNECTKMEGDTKQVETVENFVRLKYVV